MRLTRDFRTRRFWRTFALYTFSAGGAIAALLQGIDVLYPDLVSRSDLPVVTLSVVASLVYGVYRSWPRPIRQTYPLSNTEVRIEEGDLFERDSNLVIGVTTTFDTEVPHIISTRSVQGQFLGRIYHSDRAALDDDLKAALASYVPTGTIPKPGKQDRYELGTVASIRNNRRFFFCLSYTEMNNKNEARGTVDGLWRSLDSLWREVRSVSNGDPVAIPVLGGGQARMAQVLPAQDSIRFIALSFVLASRQERVCERLDIVVRREDVPKVDMLEIRSFLGSLRPS